jgi:hypothetical protein
MRSLFKKTVFFSILGHVAVFGIFTFSFGPTNPRLAYAPVSFWGRILPSSELIIGKNLNAVKLRKTFLAGAPSLPSNKTNKAPTLSTDYYLKPQVSLAFNNEKIIFAQKVSPVFAIQKRKEQAITFHPSLPYHFLLFFKDRQAVHVELMFNIISRRKMNSIVVRRKISSGNLEADLLSMRYISRYLFIEQARFMTNSWQTVKIDLSAKND